MFSESYKDSVKEKSYSTDLTTDEWLFIKDLISISATGRPIKLPLKDVVDAIFYVNKNGINWADLPHDFPDYRRVHEWFGKWQNNGTWQRILDRLREDVRETSGRAATPSEACIDSQTVKAAATGGERAYDGAKKINGRKRHILVDTMGLLMAVVVTVGSVSDARGATTLLDRLGQTVFPRLETIHGDMKYKARELQTYNADHQNYEWIFRKKPAGVAGFVPLKKRWVVERTFAWMGHYRRLARDYERTIASSEAMVQVAMIQVLIKRRRRLKRVQNEKNCLRNTG